MQVDASERRRDHKILFSLAITFPDLFVVAFFLLAITFPALFVVTCVFVIKLCSLNLNYYQSLEDVPLLFAMMLAFLRYFVSVEEQFGFILKWLPEQKIVFIKIYPERSFTVGSKLPLTDGVRGTQRREDRGAILLSSPLASWQLICFETSLTFHVSLARSWVDKFSFNA